MHDVVVVGAGAAGIPLAVRLAERGASVLLLEAGHTTGPDVATDQVPGAQPGHPGTLAYPVELTPGRPWTLHRGRGLGGSMAVNGGYFIRAREHDFAAWAAVAGDPWAYESALPLLRRLESDQQFGSSPVHGATGPMPVDRGTPHPLAESLTAAALRQGVSPEPDKNAQHAPGVGPVPTNTRGHHRITPASAYLRDRVDGLPPGLEIRSGVTVTGVRFNGTRAVGVHTSTGFIPAGETILSAGAVGSAHLLLLSGIGPAADLAAHGLTVTADLPVGQGLSDHPQVVLEWLPEAPERGYPVPDTWVGAAVHLTSPGSRMPGNLELLQSLLPLSALVTGASTPARSGLLVSDLTPRTRGGLTLASTDPTVHPVVRLGYLASETAQDIMRYAVRAGAELLSEAGAGPGQLASGLVDSIRESDSALDRWISEHLGTAVHTCATAPMGTVTDGAGRVLGVQGLRVADTSILPTAPTRGPANTAVLIGELIAQTYA